MPSASVAEQYRLAETVLDGIVLPFYAVERDMTLPPDFEEVENDAEHSWAVGTLACSLTHVIDPTLDIGLVAQFALVHDLVEIGPGDTSVWADAEAIDRKEKVEAETLEGFKKDFPETPWIIETIEDYERLESNEARYVKAMDKLIALMIRLKDGGKFYHDNRITKGQFDASLEPHRRKAHLHPGVGELYELVRAEYDNHPEYFYPE